MQQRKKRKYNRKKAVKQPQKPLKISNETNIIHKAEKVAPENPVQAEKPIKKHEFELLSQELIEGQIIETLYVKDIPAVGCLVRFIHWKMGNVISSGVFFVPTVAPIKGELRRSLV